MQGMALPVQKGKKEKVGSASWVKFFSGSVTFFFWLLKTKIASLLTFMRSRTSWTTW